MADQNEIEFKVRVTDAGLPKLADNLSKVEAEAKQLGATAEKTGDALSDVGADATAAMGDAATEARKAGQGLQDVETNAKRAGFELNKVAGAVAGAFAIDRLIDYGRSVNQVADEYKNLEARIRLAVGPHADLQQAVQGVADVATRTFSSLEATEALYSRLAASARELDITNAEALGLTETINQAIQVSGASAQASEASVRQLVQGLQSGVLRGDEFNSVMEQAPRLARALADGLGVPVGKLRELAEAGELTSARIVGALKGQAQAINTEFETLPLTTGRAIEKLNTQWMMFIGNLTGGAKESSVVAEGIEALADNLDEIAAVAERAGIALSVAMAVKAATALRAYAAEVMTAKTATSLLALEMSKVPTAINITVGLVGFEAGYQLGSWMYENTETARRLGAEIVAMTERQVNSLIFLKEAVAAVFTGDTIEAAYERWGQRALQLEQTLQTMREDASKSPAQWQAEADAATKGLDGVGAAAQTAGVKLTEAGTQGAAGIASIKGQADGVKTAMQELQQALSTFNLNDSIGIAAAGKELRELVNTGKITADEFRQAWSQALANNPDLVKFEQDAKAAFAGVEGGAQLLTDAMDAGVREAIRRSGQDFELLSAGMGKAAQSALNDTDLIIGNLDNLKSQGVDTAKALEASLSKAIDTADGQKSVDELRQRIEALRAQLGDKITDGLLADLQQQAEKLGATFEQLPEKAKDVSERTKEAFARMGIQTRGDMQKTAFELARDYELIKNSGQASAEDLAKAWQKWAEASIAANDGFASDTMRAEAAAHGLRIEVDEAGKTIVRSMKDGQKAVDDFSKGLERAAEQAKRLKELQGFAAGGGDLSGVSTEELEKAQADLLNSGGALSSTEYRRIRNELMTRSGKEKLGDGVSEVGSGGQYRNRDGWASDAKGNAIAQAVPTLMSIFNQLRSYGLDDAAANQIAREFADSQGRIQYFNNAAQKKYGGEFGTLDYAIQQAAEKYLFNLPGSPSVTRIGGGGQSGSAGNAGPMKTVNVNLPVGNGRRKTASMDEDSAAAVMKSIEFAARRS